MLKFFTFVFYPEGEIKTGVPSFRVPSFTFEEVAVAEKVRPDGVAVVTEILTWLSVFATTVFVNVPGVTTIARVEA